MPDISPWLTEARRHIGVTEIPGPAHNPVIQSWLHRLRAWWDDDETPWCGVFMAACMERAGIPIPKSWMRAKAWADWGSPLSAPIPGCIVVFEREGGGHVGLVVGRTAMGALMVLGGNQGDAVSIARFARDRPATYRWPPGRPVPQHTVLAVMNADGQPISTNEA